MRSANRLMLLGLSLLAMLPVTGCDSSGNAQDYLPRPAALQSEGISGLPAPAPAAGPHGFSLPAPSSIELGALRRSSFDVEDLRQEASEYISAIAPQLVISSGDDASFNPDWQPGDAAAGLSYAAYAFDLPDYNLNNELRFGWNSPPGAGEFWLALANWESDRWSWFPAGSDPSSVATSPLSPYFNFSGDLLAVVLLTGNSSAELDWLRVGTELPVASIVCTGSNKGFGSLTTSFDASASFDPDGSIVKYDWDWDGDGSFDNTSGSNPLIEHTYTELGTYDTAVRVIDDKGVRATASTQVHVLQGWQHTYGSEGIDKIVSVAAAPDGSVWACGSCSNVGVDSSAEDLLLLKFSANGALLKEIRWAAQDTSGTLYRGLNLRVASNGNVYVLGQILLDGISSPMIQRWSPQGELEVCNRIGGDSEIYNRLLLYGSTLYIAGQVDTGPDERKGCWVPLSSDCIPSSGGRVNIDSSFLDLLYEDSEIVGTAHRLHLCGYRYNQGDGSAFNDEDAFYCNVPLDGSAASGSSWGPNDTNQKALWIRRAGSLIAPYTVVGMAITEDGPFATYAAVSRIDAASINGFSFGGTFGADAFAGNGTGSFCAGNAGSGNCGIIEFGEEQLAVRSYSRSGELTVNCAAPYSFGVLLLGGTGIVADGQFTEVSNAQPTLLNRAWEVESVSVTAHSPTSSALPLTNAAVRSPGVLDAQTGFPDAWVSMHRLPPDL